jgi:hypothetical protein
MTSCPPTITPQFYIEARHNHISAFKVDSDLADFDAIRVLFLFGDRKRALLI